VNLEKKHFLHPHQRGDGLKLLEFTPSTNSTLTAPAVLPADGNDQGGGALHSIGTGGDLHPLQQGD
jgi:hypothetical protein